MKPAIRLLVLLAAAPVMAGCGFASAPLKNTPQVVASPVHGEVLVTSKQSDTVGGITPVYISVANGTDTSRSVVPSQVFALNQAGERVAPLPPSEAARQAGGVGELKAALTSAAVSGATAGAPAGQHAARQQAEQQLTALALPPGEVHKDFTVSGYVFFPKGDYKGLELLLVNSESGDTELVKTPWR
jgi:hypothetical protein